MFYIFISLYCFNYFLLFFFSFLFFARSRMRGIHWPSPYFLMTGFNHSSRINNIQDLHCCDNGLLHFSFPLTCSIYRFHFLSQLAHLIHFTPHAAVPSELERIARTSFFLCFSSSSFVFFYLIFFGFFFRFSLFKCILYPQTQISD